MDSGLPACQTTEQFVESVVNSIIQAATHIILRNSFRKQVFTFARDVAWEATVSQLQMRFVPCDPGEQSKDQDWEVDEEPMPGESDSWARNHVTTRRIPRSDTEDSTQRCDALKGSRNAKRVARYRPRRSQFLAASHQASVTLSTGKAATPDPRVLPVPQEKLLISLQEAKIDLQLRQLWQERIRARGQVAAQVDSGVHEVIGEEGISIYDYEGQPLAAENFDVHRLPSMNPMLGFDIFSKDHVLRLPETPAAPAPAAKPEVLAVEPSSPKLKTPMSPKSPKSPGRPFSGQCNEPLESFTDSFYRLETQQPSLHETMALQEGIVLQTQGRTQAGPQQRHKNRMAWREYMEMTQKSSPKSVQASLWGSPLPAPSGTPLATPLAQEKSPSFPSSPSSKGKKDVSLSRRAEPVEALRTSTPTPQCEVAASTGWPGFVEEPRPASQVAEPKTTRTVWRPTSAVKNFPAEPAPGLLGSRASAAQTAQSGPLRGQWRCPRQHVPMLGCSTPTAKRVAPPLGATMGHGLIVTESTEESFYFPLSATLSPVIQVGRPLSRARSAGSCRRPQSSTGSLRAWCP